MKKRLVSMIICLAMLVTMCTGVFAKEVGIPTTKIKNVIYMIPDGGGMVPYYLADAVKQAGGFNEETYPTATKVSRGEMATREYLVGAVITNNVKGELTDSAAAGTALSSGYKTKNSYVGVDENGVPYANILEACQLLGKKTGLVSTYEWTNATPAAFSAHDKDRSNYESMSEQIVHQDIDVVLGVGFGAAKWGTIDVAANMGYKVINTREELNAVEKGDKIWGNLVDASFPYDIDLRPETPNISEMTAAAITALSDSSDEGFFLMVEGSKVDGGGHANSSVGMVSEFLAFDAACEVAINYAKDRDDTIVVIAPDHDTGGMILPEKLDGAVSDIRVGVNPEEIEWESMGHTQRNGGLWIYLPEGIAYPEGISGENKGEHKVYEENVIENTELAPYIAELVGADLEAATETLFVDVTEMGEYDKDTETFRFTNPDMVAKSNASYAYYKDMVVSLDGQVCVYSEKKFYVPRLLLDIMDGKAEPTEYKYEVREYISDMLVFKEGNDKKVELSVTNMFPTKDISAQLKFTAPESVAALAPIEIGTIEEGATKTIKFDYPKFAEGESDLSFSYEIITDSGNVKAYDSPLFANAVYTSTPITVDGKNDDEGWKNALEMRLDQPYQIVQIDDWKGDRDLSASVALLWDEENIYIWTKVTDEIFSQEYAADGLWQGDSVQMGFYDDSEGLMALGKASSVSEEFAFAFSKGEPLAYRHFSQGNGSKTGVAEQGEGFEFKCFKEGDDLSYEARISWEYLWGHEYTPVKDSVIGYSVLVNDNDGNGRRGWIEYGSGIGAYKDVNDFVKLNLVDLFNESGSIKVVNNGSELTLGIAPIEKDGAVMLPLRGIFEALGAVVSWDAETNTAGVTYGDKVMTLPEGSNTMLVNGAEISIGDAPTVNDRIYLGLDAVETLLNCDAVYDAATKTVTLTSK